MSKSNLVTIKLSKTTGKLELHQIDTNSVEFLNIDIDRRSSYNANEAVKHFSKRARQQTEDDYDERYLTKTEFGIFMSINKTPNLKVKIIEDIIPTYVISR